ncbi:hypothetical protein [Flavobacterium sp.]|uniref:hypothetical protein n=1 Tax=Flavobacterium sp. TaxID=239 RepID=UPI00286DB7E7|nr:hypothetical protein [Flavobacterium sp.]
MKKLIVVILITFSSKSIVAQQNVGISGNSNWTNLWTNFNPKSIEYNEANEILSGNITENKTLYKKNVYLLNGTVVVKNNAILTIEPGTVIRGDVETIGTLLIAKNSKLIANGNLTDPIIFTSNKPSGQRRPGDWGGIILYGDAPINTHGGFSNLDVVDSNQCGIYGGNNADSDSGVINFIRIEFAGKKVSKSKEFNGLTIAGVGKKTILSNIQVSFSDDDSFEMYGGNVILNNLVSYRSTDDDFDFTEGTQATISNSLALRNPYNSDTAISRSFEIGNYSKKENTDFSKKATSVIANNVTLVNTEENASGLVKEAIYITEGCALKLTNSLVYGYSQGMILDDKISTNDGLKNIILDNVQFYSVNKIAKFETVTTKLAYNTDFQITTANQIDIFYESNFKKPIDFRIKNASSFAYNK